MDEKKKMKNIRQVLKFLEGELAGKKIISYMEDTKVVEVSAEQFFDRIRQTAWLIKERGLIGGHIGLIGRNSYEWLVSLCAIFWTGSVAVLLDWESDAEALVHLASRTDMDAVIYDTFSEKAVSDAVFRDPLRKIQMREIKGLTSVCRREDIGIEKEADELSCIFFTSGTTAESKAVMMSEGGLTAGICHRINDRKFKALMAVLPFHHLSGFSIVLNALYLGVKVCIAEDLKYFYRYLKYMKTDYISVVPSMLRMLARKLKNGGPNGSLLGWDLHFISCGGAEFCPEFLQILLERNIVILQGYGTSETGAIGFLWEMTPQHPDTIGKPPAQLEAKILNGELYLRSEAVMTGYYDDEEATKSVLENGWVATGDLCRKDEEGLYYLTGRRKNVIILANGENVSPEEIEKKLHLNKEISEVVVRSEKNLIVAEVFPEYPAGCSCEEKERIRYRISKEIHRYNENTSVYKQIQKIYFSDMPIAKNAMGKLKR